MHDRAIRIRPAYRADAPALAALRYEFRAELGDATEPRDAFLDRCGRWMAERLEGGTAWRCWVAERGAETLGTAWAQSIEKLPNPVAEPETHVYVTNCYVRPEERGRGLGGMLLDEAIAWGREIDAHTVFLWPSARSRSLYLRHGFAVREDVLTRVIGDR